MEKRKFEVFFLTPYCSYEVEAKSKKEAISKCEVPSEYDLNDGPTQFCAIKKK